VIVFGDIDDLRGKIDGIAQDHSVEVEKAGGALLITGTVKHWKSISQIETVSKAYSKSVINFIKVEEPQQVLLQVKVAQINRSKLKELGLGALVKGIDSGNAELTAPGLVATPDGELGGDAGLDVTPGIESFDLDTLVPQIGVTHFPSGVSAFLRALASKGLTTLLAEPNLVVRSGEAGEFHVGSRVPIQTVEDNEVNVDFEEVGIRLNFTPQVLEDGTIDLKIDPAEVSSIAEFIQLSGILAPQIDTRTVKTSVQLKEGESLILAGLLSDEMKKNIQKIPILGDIPILGAIFRSTRDELETTELAFFITPMLVKPMAPGETPPDLPGQGENAPTEEELKRFQWIPTTLGSGEPEVEEPEAEEPEAKEEEK
jgi:pilus assembly protein CpaC